MKMHLPSMKNYDLYLIYMSIALCACYSYAQPNNVTLATRWWLVALNEVSALLWHTRHATVGHWNLWIADFINMPYHRNKHDLVNNSCIDWKRKW